MRIDLIRGDITERDVDAIVNSATRWLQVGRVGDGAIWRAAGPTVEEACRIMLQQKFPEGLNVGAAVATHAGRLRAKWIIHTIGPVYSKAIDRSEQLIAAYRSALRVADELGATRLAFPAISTISSLNRRDNRGKYAYPYEQAAQHAVEALLGAKTNVEYAEFVLLDVELFNAFKEVMFGP